MRRLARRVAQSSIRRVGLRGEASSTPTVTNGNSLRDLIQNGRGGFERWPNRECAADGFAGGDVLFLADEAAGVGQLLAGGRFEALLPAGRGLRGDAVEFGLPHVEDVAGGRVVAFAQVALNDLAGHGFQRTGQAGICRVSLIEREQESQRAIVLLGLIEGDRVALQIVGDCVFEAGRVWILVA